MKFPSYNRCQKMRNEIGEQLNLAMTGQATAVDMDLTKLISALAVGYDGDWAGINVDDITIGQVEKLSEMLLDFFMSSREIA